MKIVVTGGAGSGKTTIVEQLKQALGSTFAFANVDDMIRDIWARPDVLLWPEEYSRFKALVNGKEKDKVREQVFTDPDFRKALEDVMARAVNSEIHAFIDEHEHSVLEFPLLYERFNAELYSRFDHAVVVDVPSDEQNRRLLARGWTAEMIRGVRAAQFDNWKRRDFVKQLPKEGNPHGHDITTNDRAMNLEMVRYMANLFKPTPKGKVGTVAGSFNPITRGHEFVIQKAAELLDGVVVGIGKHPSKSYDELTDVHRLQLALAALESLPSHLRAKVKVEFMTERMTLAAWCRSRGFDFVVRGIRGNADVEHEAQLNLLNAKIDPRVSFLYVMPPRELIELSSTLVRGCFEITEEERSKVIGSYLSRPVLDLIYGWRYNKKFKPS